MVRFPRREFLWLAAGAAALPAVSRIASAQSYPSRLITVIVPSGAGGPTDVIARIVTEHMRGTLCQALVIENVPAANGTLGIGRVSRAKPDGYTIAFSVSSLTHVFNAAIYALPYDVVNDFEPIGLVTKDRGALIRCKEIHAGKPSKGIDRVDACKPRKGHAGTHGSWQPGPRRLHRVPETYGRSSAGRGISQRRSGHAGRNRGAHRQGLAEHAGEHSLTVGVRVHWTKTSPWK
jgi:hypothetical protein